MTLSFYTPLIPDCLADMEQFSETLGQALDMRTWERGRVRQTTLNCSAYVESITEASWAKWLGLLMPWEVAWAVDRSAGAYRSVAPRHGFERGRSH